MSEPTDTPWKVVLASPGDPYAMIETADGGEVGDYFMPEHAARIVAAVNGVETMQRALKMAQWCVMPDGTFVCPVCEKVKRFDESGHTPDCAVAAALALAEGGEK